MNPFQYRLGLRQHLMVPKPYDRKALRLKISGSGLVFFDLNRVLPAVYFNHELTINADKVAYIWTDRVLPPELAAGDGSIAQQLPQAAFGVGLCFAKLSGFVLHRIHCLFHHPSPRPSPLEGRGGGVGATAI